MKKGWKKYIEKKIVFFFIFFIIYFLQILGYNLFIYLFN
jgi:hypothetical protein